ncbi:MAG: glycoside hydrolase family 9 protein [Lentisphaeria bacterium]
MFKSCIFVLLSAFVLCAAEIRLEVEDFQGRSRLSSGEYFSGRGLCGKWQRLSTTLDIPQEGLYYLWTRYCSNWQSWASRMGEANAKKLRYFSVAFNNEKQLFTADLGSAYGWDVRRIALPAGKVKVELQAVGDDPYVDVLVLTQDFEYIPEPRRHRVSGNGKLLADKILGRAQFPPVRRSLVVPRGDTPAETEAFVIRGGGPALSSATVKARHNGQHLFLQYKVFQDPNAIFANDGKPWDGDGIELVLDGNRDALRIQHIIVNPNGTIFSEIIAPAGRDQTWKPAWNIKASVLPDGWQVEFTVPLAKLLTAWPDQPGKFRANFCRNQKNVGQLSSWAPMMGDGFADPKGCGEIELVGMTISDWQSLRIPVVNRESVALGLPELAADAGSLTIWQREQELQQVILERFAPPADTLRVFEKMNLLPNPGFEYGTLQNGIIAPFNWITTSGSGTASIVENPHSGKHSLKISGTTKDFTLSPGIRPVIDSTLQYEWRAWVKGEKTTGSQALRVVWYLLDTEARGGWGQIKFGGESRLDFTPTADWTQITLKALPPAGAVNCEFELISSGNTGTLYCDDFEFDGFGISSVDFLLPQPGFDANAEKKVVIWSRLPTDGQFTVKSNGRIVHSGKLSHYGASRWKGDAFHADLSNLETPGKYTLVIEAGGQNFTSAEFSIEDGLYLKQALMASNFYYVQRQGVEVSGWHKANFLDDAILIDRNTGKIVGHHDLAGGWQDAGDPSKQATNDMSIYGLVEFFENTGYAARKLQEKYPDILALAWHEVDRQINKCYVGDGKFYSFGVNNVSNANWIRNVDVGNFRTKSVHKLDPANWTDNLPNTPDDRFATYPPSLQWMTSGLSKFALVIRPYDAAVSEQITKIMAEDYVQRQARQSEWANDPVMRVTRGDNELGKIAMHLHLLTGNEQYRKDADHYASEIIRVFDSKLYNVAKEHLLVSSIRKWSFYSLAVTLFDYARYYSQSPLLPEVKRVLQEFVDQALYARSLDNEFGVVSHLFPGAGLRFGFSSKEPYQEDHAGANVGVARIGYLAARAFRLFGDSRYLSLADASAQWIVGRNPKGTSMLIGNGWKFAATSTTLRYCEGHGDGVIPGAVIRGMSARDDSPADFPTLNISSNPGGNANSNMHEVWQEDTIGFILVCQELNEIRKGKILHQKAQ